MLSALLPRLAGWGRAREIIYTGGSITAHDALSYGFVERVVPMEKLDEAVEGWVAAILKNGPRAIRLQKALLREWENLPLDQALVRGIEYFSEAYKTDEPGTLMRHFLQRSQRKKQ
jgi:enoyl-CoA hydratase/carnithine racemase